MTRSGLLAGRIALVTAGAGAGIGQAICRRLVSEGASVAVTDAHGERAASVAKLIASEEGATTLALTLDVTDEKQVRSVVAEVGDALGPIDVLVNNAGLNQLQDVVEMTSEVWDRVMAVSLRGTFLCTRAVVPGMVKRRRGAIVNISSVAAWDASGSRGQAHYAAAKAGVMGFTRATAFEVAPAGVRVNAVSPGFTPNEFLRRVYDDEYMARRAAEIPLGRPAEPLDIANGVLFLASDLASYVTGEVLGVTGGLYMHA